jgi:hypothetical protein
MTGNRCVGGFTELGCWVGLTCLQIELHANK